MKLAFLSRYSDIGLLVVRVGLGAMMIFHGWGKLAGGEEVWAQVGGAMGNFGITFYPVFWGLAAALTEVIGGALLALGFLTRIACILLAFVMLVATVMHLSAGDGLKGAAHAIEVGIVFLGLILVGPGRLSIDKR